MGPKEINMKATIISGGLIVAIMVLWFAAVISRAQHADAEPPPPTPLPFTMQELRIKGFEIVRRHLLTDASTAWDLQRGDQMVYCASNDASGAERIFVVCYGPDNL